MESCHSFVFFSFFFSSFFQRSEAIKVFNSSLLTALSVFSPSARALAPQSMAVDFGYTAMVHLNWATNSPFFSASTG
jgi:hypothetical protein